MASFHKNHPNIALHLINGNSFDMEQHLLNNQIDIALVENDSSLSDIKYLNYMDDELIVVTGANSIFAKRRNITLADLQQMPLVLREQGSGSLEVITNKLQESSISISTLNTLIHLGSTESIKNFLVDFDGVAILSEKAVTSELYFKQLVKINVKGFNITRNFRIALRHGQAPYAVQLFTDHLNRS